MSRHSIKFQKNREQRLKILKRKNKKLEKAPTPGHSHCRSTNWATIFEPGIPEESVSSLLSVRD